MDGVREWDDTPQADGCHRRRGTFHSTAGRWQLALRIIRFACGTSFGKD
jgi:hypothetical protein